MLYREAGLHALKTGLQEIVWPTRCVFCDAFGSLLCDECRAKIRWISQRWACRRCGAPYGWMVCTECDETWQLDGLVCACEFGDVSALMVSVMKDAYEVRLASLIGAAMATAFDEAKLTRRIFDDDSLLEELDCIAFVPATKKAFERRGFDHMSLVAQSLSDFLGLPIADVLARYSHKDQRSLTLEQRQKNLQGSVAVTQNVCGAHILLADDVVTTGASMRACAQALKDRGAASVVGLGFCRVY